MEEKNGAGDRVVSLILLWLAGAGLRFAVLAVPPVIPEIRADLHLSQTEIGLLSGLPPVLFALAAVPGSLLIARFGAASVVSAGLFLTALGGALRGLSQEADVLFLATIVMSFGVAISQPAMPPLVREWSPTRIPFATAVYTNGLLVGEGLPVALTIPFILPIFGGGWRAGLAVWSIPTAATALLVALRGRRDSARGTMSAERRPWIPDWREGRLWRLAFIFGAVNSIYFTTNGFIPDYFQSIGRPDLIGGALTALNFGQIPASIVLLFSSGRIVRARWPYSTNGLLALVGVVGLVVAHGAAAIAFAGLIGFACAGTLILALALPPLLYESPDVPRMSAGVFTVSYTCALVVPVASGAAWDATGVGIAAFAPSLACAIALVLLPLGLDLRSASGGK